MAVSKEVDQVLERLGPHLRQSSANPSPIALMMCGIAGAGKSTIAKAVVDKFPTFERLSIDGILASRHGIYGVDYDPSEYAKYQDEADEIFRQSFETIFGESRRNIVLDRSFWDREDRNHFKELVERREGRWVLIYLKVPKDVLWQRICARREAEVNADSALDISEDLLDMYFRGFNVPEGEGEIVVENGLGSREIRLPCKA